MNLLIDIAHPAHVHLFKNITFRLVNEGHQVLFTCRDRENIKYLLQYYGFEYVILGKHQKSLAGKLYNLFYINYKMLILSLKFKPDIYLGNGSMFAAFSAFVLHKVCILHEQTGNMEQIIFYLPFTKYIMTPSSVNFDFGKKQFRYNGFQESFYLHKKYFQPNQNILNKYGIDYNTPYLILRFVKYNASHDLTYKTLDMNQIIQLIKELAKNYKLFISYEGGLPKYLERWGEEFDPEDVHHLLAFAKAYIGQSATMASEAAHIGIPAIFIKSLHENTAGVIDYLNNKGYIETIDYSSHQVNDILHSFKEIVGKSIPDIQQEICDPNEILYKAIYKPKSLWR